MIPWRVKLRYRNEHLMADLQFQEEEFARPDASTRQGFAAWLVAKGIAKDEPQASRLLLAIALGAIVLMFLVPALFGSSNAHVPQSEIDAAFHHQPLQ